MSSVCTTDFLWWKMLFDYSFQAVAVIAMAIVCVMFFKALNERERIWRDED